MITIQLKTRIITAVIMAIVFLFLLFLLKTDLLYLPFLSCLAFSGFTFLAITELAQLGSAAVHRTISKYTFLFFFSLPLFAFLINNYYFEAYLPMGMVLLFTAGFFCCYGMVIGRENLYLTNNLYRFLFPAFIIINGLLSLLHLIIIERDIPAILWLILVVALNDSCAYFIGKKYGKTPLAMAISPNKTIGGMWGGVLIAVAIGVYLLRFVYPNFNLAVQTLLVSLVVIFAIFGDLIESYLKRNSGFKDSSQLLPGHGGILDRIDGLLMAAPIVLIFDNFYV